MIITIDGPSGTGKSTIARLLAENLKFDYLDSGAMYRGLALQMLEKNIDASDFEQIEELSRAFNFHSRFEKGNWLHYLGSQDITNEIRTEEVSTLSSKIATYAFVRKAMAALQRGAGERGNLVCEGRDIGTVIFPNAQLKIFLTASADIRAKRRFEEMRAKFPDQHFDLEEIKQSIIARDAQDANREIAPLLQAEDAHVIDTSTMTIAEVVEAIKKQVKS